MGRRGENIFKRKDGRWEARFIKGYDLSGKPRYGFCYGKTYKEAKEKVALCRAAMVSGAAMEAIPDQHSFAWFCLRWMDMMRNRVKESTYAKYDSMLTKHILPKLGGFIPAFIDGRLVEQFKQEMLVDGLAVKTVRDILTLLSSLLKYTAVQYPGTCPVVEIKYPKEQKKEARVMNLKEQRKLVEYLCKDMDRYKFGVLLALLTGLRLGELCALKWENVSLKDRTVTVTATMQRIRNLENDCGRTRIIIGSPKTETSIRVIPLTEYAVRLCARFDPHNRAAFVLTGRDWYVDPRVMQRRLALYTRECGLTGVHFHTIRHTFATRCVEAGFEIKSLSEILGHANTAITMNRYVHSSMELKRENMEKLASVGM